MVIFVCEGAKDLVDLEVKITRNNCLKHNGLDCQQGPVEHWFETRFVVKEASEFAPYDLVFDTIEVAIPWDDANVMYEDVVQNILEVPGAIMASGHASHFYPTGVCFYFTFTAIPREGMDYLDLYNQCWDAAITTVLNHGGSASHHHGMGLNRTRWSKLEHGSEFQLMQQIKKLVDPNNIMNPGKLFGEEDSKDFYLNLRQTLNTQWNKEDA
jgi:alkyldihydroxyacetonephosphate synthase